MAKKSKRKSLRQKYRISIINEETYDEVQWWRLSPINILIFVFIVFTLVGGGTAAVIVFTPLKQYIPGFPTAEMQENIARSTILADSLENKLNQYGRYLNSIGVILEGDLPEEMFADTGSSETHPTFMERMDLEPSLADSLFRADIEQREKYNLQVFNADEDENTDDDLMLYKPVDGVVTNSFDPEEEHWGVDLAAAPNEKVMSVADGTVIFAEWSLVTGYVIQVQHANNLVSVYKHNSTLLKDEGNKVKAGEAIAIIGNSGELTTGPHLHLELWKDGKAIDPEKHIVF
ncbi:M23 family metallopeptidase [Saccharicrinis sp. FJH54]|uniref:M23 family metallopeptidase n=1 Tax=Saccharicrinis sp. FJH54 TaxID=3344665 RepID=UPI0035D44B0C